MKLERSGGTREVEPKVVLLNVDLELFGDFDRETLLRAFGGAVHAIAETERHLSVELSDGPDATLMTKISQFIALIEALPRDARAAWDSATRRVFSVGIQSGLEPHCTEWTLPTHLLASLAEIGAEVTLTIYGAEYETR